MTILACLPSPKECDKTGMTFGLPHIDAQSGQQSGRDVFTLAMTGANTSGSAQVVPSDLQAGRSNYFIGSDSSQWVTGEEKVSGPFNDS